MACVQINVLGSFEVRVGGEALTGFRSSKARALLAYLAMHAGAAVNRATLADLLWGELPERAARTNLRIELSGLNRLLGEDAGLDITRQTVCLAADDLEVDAASCSAMFRHHGSLTREAERADWNRLEDALDAYRGRFLEGLEIADAPQFDDWRRETQDALDRLATDALSALERHQAANGNWPKLVETARRHLHLDPWNEQSHRHVMQGLAAQGQTSQALGQYDALRALLADELGTTPDEDTERLAGRLRERPGRAVRQTNLGARPTPLIGRDEQIDELSRRILRDRMTTVLGLGGVGKTRMAQAVGEEVIAAFPDGVWFVSLAPILGQDPRPVDRIALAIAAAMGLQPTSATDPLGDLMTDLANRHVLIILDNWEHLQPQAADLLQHLLQIEGVHVLATSRVRLNVEGERVYPLQGLRGAAARQLFVERAEEAFDGLGLRVDPPAEPDAVQAICDAVAGLPLGLELAASWAGEFSIEEIHGLILSVGVEPSRADGLQSRHHDLTRVLSFSWGLLPQGLQRLLARFTVFRGSFHREAAAAVANATPEDLAQLCSHSLLERIDAGRYGLHPLVEEFAGTRLDVSIRTEVAQRHRRHYLTRVAAGAGSLADMANIRKAWISAVDERDGPLIALCAAEFAALLARTGLIQDGFELFGSAIAAFETEEGQGDLVALLLSRQWHFSRAIHGLPGSEHLQFRVLALSSDPELTVETHLQLANRFAEDGLWAKADHHFEEAAVVARRAGGRLLAINAARMRAHVNALHFRGDFEQHIAELKALRSEIAEDVTKDEGIRALDLELGLSLALVAMRHGDHALAIRTGRSNLALVEAMVHRQRRISVLLDLALSEQFAGLLEESLAHNREALAEAEEIGAMDDIGLLCANLCMVLRKAGDLEGALAYGKRGVDVLGRLRLTRMSCMARNRVGHVLVALGRWAEAEAVYVEVARVWETLGHSNVHEAHAGRAVAMAQSGRLEEAEALADSVLDHVLEQGTQGLVEPVLLLWGLSRVYGLAGKEEKRQQVRALAEKVVARASAVIGDEELLRRYLDMHSTHLEEINAAAE
ncbi:BTAD domain-containing putative transcriptional regulator [Cucumibacter marinus]|uniref:BTAD domain-containing putative transcriptional regulator n=1 Tax=Cucumibacter marinus TaxID=1121252 RepID=UPI00048B27D1|nr:BTAD domain-containing putative transcriptional regulator [Cucumibacter marinus]